MAASFQLPPAKPGGNCQLIANVRAADPAIQISSFSMSRSIRYLPNDTVRGPFPAPFAKSGDFRRIYDAIRLYTKIICFDKCELKALFDH